MRWSGSISAPILLRDRIQALGFSILMRQHDLVLDLGLKKIPLNPIPRPQQGRDHSVRLAISLMAVVVIYRFWAATACFTIPMTYGQMRSILERPRSGSMRLSPWGLSLLAQQSNLTASSIKAQNGQLGQTPDLKSPSLTLVDYNVIISPDG